MMKRNLFLFVLFLFVFSSVVFAEFYEENFSTLTTYKFPSIQLQQLRYEPYPVNPGEYFDLWIKAENLGYGLTPDASFKLFLSYPFSLEPDVSPIQYFGKIAYGQPVVLRYKVKINEDAVNGVYDLKMGYNINNASDNWIYKDFKIKVADAQTDFDFVIQEVSDRTVSIAIANTGKNIAYSVIVKIPEQENFETIGTSGQMVGNLENGDYTMVSFDLREKSRISEKKFLNVQIDYTDTLGNRRVLFKQINFDFGGFSALISGLDGSSATQFGGRAGLIRPVQEKLIYQELWFWAVILTALLVFWKAVKIVRGRKRRK